MAATISTGVSRTAIEDKLRKFDNIVTVSKAGHGDFVCSDYASDAACIQAALDYIDSIGGGVIYIQNGHYHCAARLEYTSSNLRVYGDGDETLLDFTEHLEPNTWNGSLVGICMYVHGKITTTNSLLTVAAAKGDLTINVADGTKFSVGDWIRIRSEAIFQPRYHLDDYWTQKVGEIQQIKSINGNEITLQERMMGNYELTDTATVDLVTMLENITFSDFKMVCSPTNYNIGIDIQQAYNVTVENVTCIDIKKRATTFLDVVSGVFANNRVTRSNLDPLGYGLAVMNASREIHGYGNTFYDCRHGITNSGDTLYGIQYNQVFNDNIQSYCSEHDGMFGAHPTVDGIEISNNTCIGCSFGYVNCKNAVVTGNIALNSEPGYGTFMIREAGENVVVSNNVFESIASASIIVKSEYPNILIDGNVLTSGAVGISVRDHISNISIQNNIINSVANPIKMYYNDGIDDDTTDSSDISIDGNQLNWSGDAVGIEIKSTHNYNKVNVVNNTLTPSTPRMGIRVSTTNVSGVNSVINISNNKCFSPTTGIYVEKSEKINIESNKIYNATFSGIYFNTGCAEYLAVGNIIDECVDDIVDRSAATDRIFLNNKGFNPVGNFTAPTMPASTVAYTNTVGYPCRVTISGGTVTEITLDGIATGLTSGAFVIPIGGTIAITYSSAPTWKWWGL